MRSRPVKKTARLSLATPLHLLPVEYMATRGALAAISVLGFGCALAQSADSQGSASDAGKPGAWLFPVDTLNDVLPSWLQFGGEYRARVESNDGLGYKPTNDTFL